MLYEVITLALQGDGDIEKQIAILRYSVLCALQKELPLEEKMQDELTSKLSYNFV